MHTRLFKALFGGGFAPSNSLLIGSGDGGDGGDDGGGGGGEGGDSGKLSAEQEKEVNRVIHSAITRRFEQFSESMNKLVTDTVSEAIGNATGSIVEKVTEAVSEKVGSDSGKGKGSDATDWTQSEEYQKMLKREQARDKELERLREERKAEVEQRKRSEEQEVLSAALAKAGVPAERLRFAIAAIKEDGRVKRKSETDEIYWEQPRDGYSDALSLTEGVAEYLTTDEGKALLPATNARGTGTKRTRNDGGSNNHPGGQAKMDKDEAADVIVQGLFGGGFQE